LDEQPVGRTQEAFVAIYMKYGNIKGDATQSDHEDWINIDDFTWQIDWNIQNRASIDAKNNTRDGAHPTIGNIMVKKTADGATTHLLKAITNPEKLNGEHCIIRFLLTSLLTGTDHDAKRQPFLEYILYDTLITQIQMHADANSRPTETITLNFTAVAVNLWSLDRSNTRLDPAHRFHRYDKIEHKK
jgi:type VI secretion system secreted protein Hcp